MIIAGSEVFDKGKPLKSQLFPFNNKSKKLLLKKIKMSNSAAVGLTESVVAPTDLTENL